MSGEDDFEPRLGRIRSRGASGRTFVGQVLRAATRSGLGGGRTPRNINGRGRGAALAARLRAPGRRVLVKTRIVRHAGARHRAAPLPVHIRYLQRDGVDRSGERGRMFDCEGEADPRGFADRCENDRHHFRFILSPEDAGELADLRAFTRDLMRGAEADLGTRLDWIAVDHWNTAHPHVHVLLRGVDDQGADLVIAREYLTQGLRRRAERLVELELGPRTAREIARGLERDATAERWTALDDLLLASAREGVVDLRPGDGLDRDLQPLLAGRAVTLERLGLACPEGVGAWRLAEDWATRLRGLAARREILERLHGLAEDRPLSELHPDGEQLARPLVGRLVARGLHDELTGEAFAVVDGVDGRLHHVRVIDLGAAGDTPSGGLVEIRPAAEGARLAHRSDLDLARQTTVEGATWLDRQLVAREPVALVGRGFGAAVSEALATRTEWLKARGLADLREGRVRFAPGLLASLRDRELGAAGRRLAAETGLRFEALGEEPVRGVYRSRVDLASGRFVMVERDGEFRLAPWGQALDRRLGQEVSGAQGPGGMTWDLGRGRGR